MRRDGQESLPAYRSLKDLKGYFQILREYWRPRSLQAVGTGVLVGGADYYGLTKKTRGNAFIGTDVFHLAAWPNSWIGAVRTWQSAKIGLGAR